jgi:hypothetical protein
MSKYDYKNEILALVRVLNENSSDNKIIFTKVFKLLASIFKAPVQQCETNEVLSVLYRLIFQTFHKNRTSAYSILSGFILFGQTKLGKRFKPLLDHLAIEAVDELLILGGWSILKNCLTTLKENVDESLTNEPVFIHIVSRVIAQLNEDANALDTDNITELCCSLPRERSYTWGWFSYYVAHAFYQGLGARRERVNSKTMRSYLKYYRKMITTLRRAIYDYDPEAYDGYYNDVNVNELVDNISETWFELLLELSGQEYSWVYRLFNMPFVYAEPATEEPATEEPATEEPHNEIKDEAEVAVEVSSPTLFPLDDELVIVSSVQEVTAYALEEINKVYEPISIEKPIEEKKEIVEAEANPTGGWFSWLGWS